MSKKTSVKASKKISSKSKAKAKAENWPKQRDVLWRPQRFTYLQKKETSACVFCDARDQGVKPESLVIFEDDMAMVILNKFPYNNGHLLVLPVRHVADIEDLSLEESNHINEMIRRSISGIRKAYEKPPQGMNVGTNLGSAAGAGIPQHLHHHIIPRWIGDANFFPLVGDTKVISETLEQTYKRLLPYFR